MADVCEARRGRGAGNGGNSNWFNSPLWKSIEAKNNKLKSEVTNIEENKNVDLDNMDLKAKQRKMYALAY